MVASSGKGLFVAVILASLLCGMFQPSLGETCNGPCGNFEDLPSWQCNGFQIIDQPFQPGVCQVGLDVRGCCVACSSGLIDASSGIANVMVNVRDILNRIATFNGFEQTLLIQILADLQNVELYANLGNVLNNVGGLVNPNLCSWGQSFATMLWRIKNDCDSILTSVDQRGGGLLAPDRSRIDAIKDLVDWFKRCLLPKVLDRTELECFKDDLGCGSRHRPFCKPDCRCSECRSNNDCTEPNRPNCRNNRAGIMICGDPHISQTIQGADPRRLCYDFVGKPGAGYLFFRDHDIDIKTTFVEDEGVDAGSFVDYIGQINVTGRDFLISISPDEIRYATSNKDTSFTWKDQTVNLDVGLMAINKKQINMVFNNGTTELVITRKGRAKGTPFLNFGVTEKTGLSRNAGGIMGWIGNEAAFEDEGLHSGYITMGGVTIPVYDNKDGCLKIDEPYLNKFGSILHMFEIV